MALRPKQQRFVEEYLVDLNATQAAIRAGYSVKVAAQQAYENLRKPEVSKAIAAAQAARAQRLQVAADEAREQNACIALADPIDIVDAEGHLLPLHQMPARIRRAIRSIEIIRRNVASGDGVTDVAYKITFWDKLRALEMEYKHFGLLTDRVEHSGELRISWIGGE